MPARSRSVPGSGRVPARAFHTGRKVRRGSARPKGFRFRIRKKVSIGRLCPAVCTSSHPPSTTGFAQAVTSRCPGFSSTWRVSYTYSICRRLWTTRAGRSILNRRCQTASYRTSSSVSRDNLADARTAYAQTPGRLPVHHQATLCSCLGPDSCSRGR